VIHFGYGEKEEGYTEKKSYFAHKAAKRTEDLQQESAFRSEKETFVKIYLKGDS
jgi:hypothetical protein